LIVGLDIVHVKPSGAAIPQRVSKLY
jgi:hypothetical protein